MALRPLFCGFFEWSLIKTGFTVLDKKGNQSDIFLFVEINMTWTTTCNNGTVKPVLSDHSKKDKTKILMTNGNLMKVESIAECSHWIILQYF